MEPTATREPGPRKAVSFLHSGPCGRVSIEPKTSESEGSPRRRRQPDPEKPGEGDRSSGTGKTAIYFNPSALHNLVANNLQLHSHPLNRRHYRNPKQPNKLAGAGWLGTRRIAR